MPEFLYYVRTVGIAVSSILRAYYVDYSLLVRVHKNIRI